MISKRHSLLCAAVGALAILGQATPARAASNEYVSVILDQTGSMLEPAGSNSTRWAESIKAAKSTLNQLATTTAYGVWTFKQSADQNGPKQLWPLSAADCPQATNFESIVSNATGEASNFCKLATRAEYTKFIQKLDAIAVDPSQIPQSDWLTPLADSLCKVMENISTSNLSATKTFLFESDAGENVSGLDCSGIGDTLAPAAWTFTTNASNEWGMTLDSWQAKVTRKLSRFNSKLTTAVASRLSNTTKNDFDQSMATYGVNWQVDVHYQIYPSSGAMLLSAPSAAQLAPMAITDVSVTQLLQAPSSARAAAGSASLALAAAASTGTPSINPAELAFFKALGKSGPRSKFREFVTVPGAVYGTSHKLPGDVDDSGCTDQADLNIIKQQDVWLKRAIDPLQIAIRADVSRDGWVDQADVDVVVAHWAQGCINPVPKPRL